MKLNNHGEMGVSTMIIFTAMVLVAAVAASVLISTANTLREQATQTGNDALNSVSNGYDLVYVSGEVSDNKVTVLHTYLRLGAGSNAIDSNGTIVSLAVSSPIWSVDADLPCDPNNTVVVDGRVEMTIDGLSIAPGSTVSIVIIPAYGYTTYISFIVPEVLTPGVMMLR